MSKSKRRTAVKISKSSEGRRAGPVKSSIAWQDDSLALVDYESTYAATHKIKYLNYLVRTLKRTMEQHHFPCKIRMIVIYTADIQPQQTNARMDIGCLQFQLEDTDMQRFLLSGMLVFADKVITKEDSKQIKEWIMMTKVGQLFEEEKIQYGREIEKRVTKDVTKNVTENVTKNVTKSVTKTNELKFSKILLHAGLSIEEISNAMTVLTADDIRKIAEKINPKSDIRKADPK